MTSLMNVWNQDGFPSIATALLFGTTLVPLNQSTATTGYIPQIQTNGGLTLTAPSALGITWANVLAAGNTSGATDPIISSPQTLIFAANSVKIGVNGVSKSSSTGDILIGSGTRSGGSTQPIIVIGSGTGNALNTAVSPTIVIGSGTASLSGGGQIVIGSGTGSSTNGIAIGSSAVAGSGVAIGSSANVTGSGVGIGPTSTCGSANSVAIGINSTVSSTCAQGIAIGNGPIAIEDLDIAIGPLAGTVGTGGSGRRIAIGDAASAGAASIAYSIAIGSVATSSAAASIAIGRSCNAAGTDSIAISTSSIAATLNDIAIGSVSTTTGAGGGHSRICIGPSANAGSAGTLYNIAIGSQANANTANNNIAIGRLATATHSGSVAIGTSSTTTAANQIMLGNNATGGITQVYGDVGATGLMESAGYLVSLNQVRASIRPTAGQAVVSGSGFVVVVMDVVTYASDYGSPAITSAVSALQTRADRCMIGYFNLFAVFNAPPAANGFFTIRIQKNTNGVVSTISSQQVFVLAGVTDYATAVPFSDFNAAVPAANVYYYCDVDNPALFGQTYTIQTNTHFVGQMTN